MFHTEHRRVSPSRESTGSDIYVVTRYDPQYQTCDLNPDSINQRGALTQVPICQPFGGSWEFQTAQGTATQVDASKWGNATRGPRWGVSLPIQPGDRCRVMYVGESMSDPVITEFYRDSGNHGVPYTANQVLSTANDYTNETPSDDDLLDNRFDLLLPSGAWVRSGAEGSWTIATPPVDRAKSFVTLHPDGQIKIKARGESDYTVHLEFDPTNESGRICIGKLADGAYLEFKQGAITLKGKSINLNAEAINGNARPQASSSLDALASMPASVISDSEMNSLMSHAAGESILQTAGGIAVPSLSAQPGVTVISPTQSLGSMTASLFNAPGLDADLLGRMQDSILRPDRLINQATNAFKNGLPLDSIADRLTGLLGANALTGGLGNITSVFDLNSLSMLETLGVPSWIAEGLSDGINIEDFESLIPQLGSMTDNKLLQTLLQQVGAFAMNGEGRAPGARNFLNAAIGSLDNEDLQERIQTIIGSQDLIPIRLPQLENGERDWKRTIAQRLGRHILRGNNLMGGPANLFDFDQLESLGLDNDTYRNVRRVANRIAEFYSNPHSIPESIPSTIAPYLEQLGELPPEVRKLISQLPQELIPNLSNLGFSAIPGEDDHPFHETRNWSPDEQPLAALLKTLPDRVRGILRDLPTELLGELQGLPLDQFKAILDNPAALIDGEMLGVLRGCFGNFKPNIGTIDMRVTQWAKFNPMPQIGQILTPLGNSAFHLQTEATQIERNLQYGRIDMPDFWSDLTQ